MLRVFSRPAGRLTRLYAFASAHSRGVRTTAMDGNTASSYAAYACTDQAFGFPITPSSQAFQLYDQWSQQGNRNALGAVPDVNVMQSEGGVAGALHGAVATGSLSTSFTSSQGLMLMVPNMFKMGTAYMPCVVHVAARSMIRSIGSMYTDHSDVLATRATGWGIMFSANSQECHDLGLASHIASLLGGVPMLHCFEGFRTSHEMSIVQVLEADEIAAILPWDAIRRFRARGFNPEHPHVRGAAVNQDAFFQWSEFSNVWFDKFPDKMEEALALVEKATGRKYNLVEYAGHPDAEHVVVVMGSASETVEEVVQSAALRGERVGVVKVRMYRPWPAQRFLEALPATVKRLTVLDRVREPGASRQPLATDVISTVSYEHPEVRVLSGIYGISGKNFSPDQVHAVFKNMQSSEPRDKFTVGITDDVTMRSLTVEEHPMPPVEGTLQCLFWGVGADGTVGANQQYMQMVASVAPHLHAQGHFMFEAKKTGGWTLTNLRVGTEPIKGHYDVECADFIGCHSEALVKKYPEHMVAKLKQGGTVLINCTATNLEEVEALLPAEVKKLLGKREAKLFVVDAGKIARELGLGRHINMIMQAAFMHLADLPGLKQEDALGFFKNAISKMYSKKGEEAVQRNLGALDMPSQPGVLCPIDFPVAEWAALTGGEAQTHWYDSELAQASEHGDKWQLSADSADVPEATLGSGTELVERLFLPVMAMKGETLPVSAFREVADGRVPTGTSRFEKRSLAAELPVWDHESCTQCNECALVCPHAAIRTFIVDKSEMKAEIMRDVPVLAAPQGVRSRKKWSYVVQTSPSDCLGCSVCAVECASDSLHMKPLTEMADTELEQEQQRFSYLQSLPDRVKEIQRPGTVKGLTFKKPLLEFPGSCAGCAQTSYVKMVTQLFGERMIVANATGCSLIWAASFPAIAYTKSDRGFGPAWGNSLFEDNAEYGYGMFSATAARRRDLQQRIRQATEEEVGDSEMWTALTEWAEGGMSNTDASERLATQLKDKLATKDHHGSEVGLLSQVWHARDILRKPSHWIFGGDGWAYDIGFGGLDHVLASGADVNVLVMDNEEYANTGHQVSKATPQSAAVPFASGGKHARKKNLGLMMMTYGNIYVASVSLGSSYQQALKAVREAEAYPGPSLIIAYCPCEGHGVIKGSEAFCTQMKVAVDTGYWPLYRYDPRRAAQGELPLQLDSKRPEQASVDALLNTERRFANTPEECRGQLQEELAKTITAQWNALEELAGGAEVAPESPE